MSIGKKWRLRDRARRQQAQNAEVLRMQRGDEPREKKWRFLYLRSEKLARAKQLGIDYPRKTERQVLAEHVDSDADGATD